jgi:predicted dehydrogenase
MTMPTTAPSGDVTYQFQSERKVRVGFIGAGAHSYRNIYPAFQYAPVDLRAVCDVDIDRAREYARLFGAAAVYDDHEAMIQGEDLDAVFIVTAYDDSGEIQATALAEECLRAGLHVWMEKPTASSVAAVRRLEKASLESGCLVMTGMKKMFTPAIDKLKSIISSPDFGGTTSISVRYPQALPRMDERNDPLRMIGFLDHIYHPIAAMRHLMGPIDRMSYEWEPRSGASVSRAFRSSAAAWRTHWRSCGCTRPIVTIPPVKRSRSLLPNDRKEREREFDVNDPKRRPCVRSISQL